MTTKKLMILANFAFVILMVAPSAASALTASQVDVFNSGVYYFNTEEDTLVDFCGTGDPGAGAGGGGSTAPPSQITIDNAKIVIGVAKTDNLGKQGALIGLMVGLTESSLTNLPNQEVPVSETAPNKQSDAKGDWDSVGIMQQRVSTGWSTLAPAADSSTQNDKVASRTYSNSHPAAVFQLMTPAYAAEAFFGAPAGSDAPRPLNTVGLQNISGWQSLQPWVAAQKVQNSGTADGSNYRAQAAKAQSLLNQYWDSSDPVPLPVPLSGGTSTGGGDLPSCTSGTNAGSSGSCNVSSPVYGSVNGSGSEYSQQQLAQIFGDPGTATDHSTMQSKQVTVNFLGNSVSVNPLVAPCLQAVAVEIQKSGSTYKINQMGCYRFDSDNGTSNIGLRSYHTYGAACDINWDTNPFVESGTPTPHDMPQEYITAFHDHGFTYGGDWHQPKDYMHFEFNGISPGS
jgi:hypothetical protein